MTSHRIVNRLGLLGLVLTGLAALWIVGSQSVVAQSPNIDGGAWQFDADSTGNVVEIKYSGLPAAGLGAADITVAFDSTVLNISACGAGDLLGACNPNFPSGPARAAGFSAPAITTDPVTIATLTFKCVAAGSSALTITVNELVDGTVGGRLISAGVTNGSVTCGMPQPPFTDLCDTAMCVQVTTWRDAEEISPQKIEALVNGVDCASPSPWPTLHPDPAPYEFHSLAVLSDDDKPGCSRLGDTVQFRLDGEEALPTVAWSPGWGGYHNLMSGEPFAGYSGFASIDGEPGSPFDPSASAPAVVLAFVDGVECGRYETHYPSGWIFLKVLPAGLKPGCATSGSIVTFTLDGLPAIETVIWEPGLHGQELHAISPVPGALPNGGGTPPSAGDFGLGRGVVALVAGMGLIAVSCAGLFTLRRARC